MHRVARCGPASRADPCGRPGPVCVSRTAASGRDGAAPGRGTTAAFAPPVPCGARPGGAAPRGLGRGPGPAGAGADGGHAGLESGADRHFRVHFAAGTGLRHRLERRWLRVDQRHSQTGRGRAKSWQRRPGTNHASDQQRPGLERLDQDHHANHSDVDDGRRQCIHRACRRHVGRGQHLHGRGHER